MESGSTSAEETSSSTDLHPLQSNLGDASCILWESWTGHDASSAAGDELITSTANSAADQALGCTSSSRQLLTFQQQSDILSSPGWFSGFCNPVCPPHAASGITCQNPGAADPAADDPPCTSSFTSDGQLVQSAMCNSSPDPDQYCDIAGFEFADHRYIRTAAKHHHPESAHYYSMSPTACDEGLSSESYSNYSRADNKSVYAKPLQVAPLTALQLLQSIDPESPSSPLSLYHNSPLPSFGNWDGGAGHHGLPASTWVDCSPPTSQPLAGCTTLRLMHHDADGGQSTDAGSCQYNSTELRQLQASSKRELFPAMTDTSAPADPYYTIYHPARPAICDHPSISSCMIDGAGQFDPALIQRSSGTRGLLCNTENLLNASRVNCFSTPWSPFSHEDIQLDSGNSGRGSMEVLSSALSEGERRTSGSLCFSQDFQLTQLEERAASSTVGMTTVLANAVHTSCSGSEILVADPAPQHLRDLQRPAAAKHRLELVEIDCDDVEASPAPRPKRKATYEPSSSATARQRIQNPRAGSQLLEPKSNACNSKITSSSSSLSFEVSMDMIAVGPALNTNGKPRARRGSATDPQSIYARHRRNKINERLKTLQHLVPNGSKVDIVTMLEAAIDYVKYLQDQVKLLKMEQWMSATPTIYNGVDISAI